MSLALLTREPKTRGSRSGGSPSLAARSRGNAAASECARGPSCDFCRGALRSEERHRLVWESSFAAELVLADLCRDCATFADRLLELYGGCGREAITLVQEIRPSPPPRTVQPRVLGYAARGVLYLVIAVASLLLVTLVTSRGR